MQVNASGVQVGQVNCGLHAVIQAEVICDCTEGRYRWLPELDNSSRGRVVCEGTHGNYLLDPSSWFTEADVAFTRVVMREAFLGRVRVNNARDAVLARDHDEAWGDLTKMWSQNKPKPDDLWYTASSSSSPTIALFCVFYENTGCCSKKRIERWGLCRHALCATSFRERAKWAQNIQSIPIRQSRRIDALTNR